MGSGFPGGLWHPVVLLLLRGFLGFGVAIWVGGSWVSAVGRGVSGTGFRGGWRAAGRGEGLLLFSGLLC